MGAYFEFLWLHQFWPKTNKKKYTCKWSHYWRHYDFLESNVCIVCRARQLASGKRTTWPGTHISQTLTNKETKKKEKGNYSSVSFASYRLNLTNSAVNRIHRGHLHQVIALICMICAKTRTYTNNHRFNTILPPISVP